MKKLRYIFGFSIIIFVLTSIHLWYQYVAFSSDKIPSKWGTVIEGTSQPITYLPYLSMSKSDKWYQHLLYKGCIMMWSGNQLTGDVCTVTTKDNKSYNLTLNPGLTWSDGTNLTVNDVFFTYYDIVKSNQWWLSFLDSYSKLEISQNDDGSIDVVFPRESVDNQLFFLNPILPAHHLTNQTLQYYQSQFAANPITSACATLKPQTTDKDSIIFDMTNCSEYMPQILQIKQFTDNTWLQSYIQSNPNVIDYVIDGQDDSLTQHGVKSSQAIISYFHVNTISDSTRRNIALLFNYALNLEDSQIPWLIAYDGMFNVRWAVDRNTIRRNLGILKQAEVITWTWSIGTWSSTTWSTADNKKAVDKDDDIPLLTKNMLAYGTNKYKTSYLPAQWSQFTISFKFDQTYDKIAISANGPYKYFPASYNSSTKTADYNLSTAFNNLVVGKNTYTIRWYKWDQAVTLLTLTLYYDKKPSNIETSNTTTQVVTNLDGTRTIRIIYIENPVTSAFIAKLKTALTWNNMSENFIFTPINTLAQLEDIISSKAYEVIIRPMDLGIRNDLSILVHDDPMINNAQYKNQTLKNYLADLNQSSAKTQQKLVSAIQDIYRKDMPFMILGNTIEFVETSPSITRTPDQSTTLTTVRDQLLNHIRPVYSLNINQSLLRDPTHLVKFLIGSHAR